MSLALLVIPRILVIAAKHSLYDVANKRKTHNGAVPSIGGVSFIPCILISLLFVFSIFYILADKTGVNVYYPNISEINLLFCGLLLLYLGGIKDDLAGMRYLAKFAIQFIAAMFIVLSGLYINNFYGLFNIYEISPWIGIFLFRSLDVFLIFAIDIALWTLLNMYLTYMVRKRNLLPKSEVIKEEIQLKRIGNDSVKKIEDYVSA